MLFVTVKFLMLSLLVTFFIGCTTAANMRSRYQPNSGDGAWTNELRQFDEEHPEHRTEPIFP